MGCSSTKATSSATSAPPPTEPVGATTSRTLEQDYEVFWNEVIGKGHYGLVYRGKHRTSGRMVAVKVLERSKSRKERLRLEVEILRRIGRHPNLVEMLDAYETPTSVQLVFELMAGELYERISNKGPYEEWEAALIAKKLTEAVRFLHKRGIVHRDIKPENLLLSARTGPSEVKLCDFGLAKLFTQEQAEAASRGVPYSYMHTICGTWAYSAPEVRINRQPYTHKVDAWSLGVIFYILLCGYHPFDPEGCLSEEALQENIRRCMYDFDDPSWQTISDTAKDLIMRLLVLDPVRRLDTGAILRHPWLQMWSHTWPKEALAASIAGGGEPVGVTQVVSVDPRVTVDAGSTSRAGTTAPRPSIRSTFAHLRHADDMHGVADAEPTPPAADGQPSPPRSVTRRRSALLRSSANDDAPDVRVSVVPAGSSAAKRASHASSTGAQLAEPHEHQRSRVGTDGSASAAASSRVKEDDLRTSRAVEVHSTAGSESGPTTGTSRRSPASTGFPAPQQRDRAESRALQPSSALPAAEAPSSDEDDSGSAVSSSAAVAGKRRNKSHTDKSPRPEPSYTHHAGRDDELSAPANADTRSHMRTHGDAQASGNGDVRAHEASSRPRKTERSPDPDPAEQDLHADSARSGPRVRTGNSKMLGLQIATVNPEAGGPAATPPKDPLSTRSTRQKRSPTHRVSTMPSTPSMVGITMVVTPRNPTGAVTATAQPRVDTTTKLSARSPTNTARGGVPDKFKPPTAVPASKEPRHGAPVRSRPHLPIELATHALGHHADDSMNSLDSSNAVLPNSDSGALTGRHGGHDRPAAFSPSQAVLELVEDSSPTHDRPHDRRERTHRSTDVGAERPRKGSHGRSATLDARAHDHVDEHGHARTARGSEAHEPTSSRVRDTDHSGSSQAVSSARHRSRGASMCIDELPSTHRHAAHATGVGAAALPLQPLDVDTDAAHIRAAPSSKRASGSTQRHFPVDVSPVSPRDGDRRAHTARHPHQ